MQKIDAQLMVASDCHLRGCEEDKTVLFLSSLQKIIDSRPEYFILTGDIFDFCFGSSRYFQKKYHAIGERLTQLSDAGTKVLFVQGNHEFSIEDIGWRGVEFVTDFERKITLKDGSSFVLTHGDRLLSPWHYHLYLAITRSTLFKLGGLMVPQAFLDRFALSMAAKSRAMDDTRTLDHDRLLEAANDWIDRSGCQHGIFGHFHVPFGEARKGQEGKILSVSSWDKPNFLAYHEKEGFYRLFPTLNNEWEKCPLKPLKNL